MNTNENALFAVAWIFVGLWSLVRLVQLGNGHLPSRISDTMLLFKLTGGLGMILAMFTFFANLTVLVSLVTQIQGLPAELAAQLEVVKQVFVRLGEMQATLPGLSSIGLQEKPHLAALGLVIGMLVTSELLMFPANVAYSLVSGKMREKALTNLELAIRNGTRVQEGKAVDAAKQLT